MSGRQEEPPASPEPVLAGASSSGAPFAARGDSLMAKKMCEMFDNVQGGLQVTSTFDSEGIVEALAASVETGKTTAMDAAPQESGDTTSRSGVSIITSSMKTLLVSQHSLINTRFCLFLFFNGSAENSQKSPPDWGRLEYAIFLINIVTKHANSPCVESTQSVLVSGQFWKLQLMSSLTISRTTLHASAVVMTLEVKVELSTRTEKDKVYTTISPITLHAGAIETTIES